MNINILDYPISHIPYFSLVLSTSPMTYQFPIDSFRKVYVVSVENEDTSLASSAVQLLRDKKRAISSDVILTLAWMHPYALISLEENCALFEQFHILLEPSIRHHEVFPP